MKQGLDNNGITRRSKALYSAVGLPSETVEVQKEARAFAEEYLKPRAFAINSTPESDNSFPREVFNEMANRGLYEIPFPQDVGGRGLQYPTLAILVILEEIAYYSASIASALYDAQAILVGATLNRASEALRETYLPRLVKGELVGSFATSEPAASTDLSPASMQTVATKVEGGWRLNGQKRWITNAIAADIIAVLCKSGEKEQTFLLVDTSSDGVKVGSPDVKMGNNAQLTSDVYFDDVFVPEDHTLGERGDGLKAALSALMLGRMGIGAVGVGMAQAAFDIACDHMESRKVFGQELARFQHWQFTFADHAIGLESARSLYLKAGQRFDQLESTEIEAAMAKITGSRLAVDIARDAIQVCGAYGFVRTLQGEQSHHRLESIYRDAKIGEIYEGANEIQKWIIARKIFGRDLTG